MHQDLEVSRYLAELNGYSLLDEVTLNYSEEKDFEGQLMREFKISMELRADADVRHVDPLLMPRRLRNPMDSQMNIGRQTASAGNSTQEK